LQWPVMLCAFGCCVPGYMPLAHRIVSIAIWAQYFRDRAAGIIKVSLVSCKSFLVHHVSDPGLVWIQSRQQTCASRTASGRVVELGEPKSVFSKRVEIRSFDFAAVATQVGDPHVVAEDDHEIRLRWLLRLSKLAGAKTC